MEDEVDSVTWGWSEYFSGLSQFLRDLDRQSGIASISYTDYSIHRLEMCEDVCIHLTQVGRMAPPSSSRARDRASIGCCRFLSPSPRQGPAPIMIHPGVMHMYDRDRASIGCCRFPSPRRGPAPIMIHPGVMRMYDRDRASISCCRFPSPSPRRGPAPIMILPGVMRMYDRDRASIGCCHSLALALDEVQLQS